MILPHSVTVILRTLNEHGYEAYAVGGCVRDSLLGRKAGDWDITTSAAPAAVKSLFTRTIDTGIAHGTVTVMMDHEGFEVTTYRVDGEYRDGRHPESVSFTASLEEDLKRRDFTINAMAYHPETGIVDLFEGQKDLQRRVIRCVGDPKQRFTEDALRMMRALRFRAQLDFSIEPETAAAVKELAPRLELVSHERIQAELMKLLLSDHPECLLDVRTLGMAPWVLPSFDCLPDEEREEAVRILPVLEKKKYLRLAALFCGKCASIVWDNQEDDEVCDRKSAKTLRDALRDLRLDNETIDQAVLLTTWHMVKPEADPYLVRRLLNRLGSRHLEELLQIQELRTGASFNSVRVLAGQVLERGDCLGLKQLAVNGSDLVREGLASGKQIGELLAGLLDLVLRDPSRNEREYLMKKSAEYAVRH